MSVDLREKPAVQKLLHRCEPHRLFRFALHAGAFVLGWLGARAPFLGGMRPLGICFAACLPLPFAFSSAAGSAAGCFSALSVPDCLPYAAGTAAGALLRGMARRRIPGTEPMIPPAACALICFLIRSGLAVSGKAGPAGIPAAAAEALFTLGFSYLLLCFFDARSRDSAFQDSESRAAAGAAFCAVLLCLSPLSFFRLSPAHIAAAFGILRCVCSGVPGMGVSAAVCASAALCAADPAALHAGFSLCTAALAAGLFCERGSLAPVPVFCLAGLAGVFSAPEGTALPLAVEICSACAAYLLLPARLRANSPALCSGPCRTSAHTAHTVLSGRLQSVSAALCSVGNTMRAVCSRLPIQRGTPSDLCDAVSESCCSSCGKRLYCWVDCANETYDAFAKIAARPDAGSGILAADLPPVLLRRCQTPVRLAGAISSAEAQLTAHRVLLTRSREIRTALCEQYSAMAAALAQLAGQVYCDDLPDSRGASRLRALFSDFGIPASDTSVTTDASGRFTAAATVPRAGFTPETLQQITEGASRLFRCSFAPVQCTHSGAMTRLLFTEQTLYRVESAVCSLPADGVLSGDVSRCFADDTGHFNALLCDGMGTGKAAAVGSTLSVCLAEDLMRCGFEGESAAGLVNAALTLKSDDESSVAFDAASVDLYTGGTVLYKAGAAASFLLHGGKAAVYSADTLPIGILGKVTGSRFLLQPEAGDILVLVSDGALAGGQESFCRILEKSAALPAEVLVRSAALAAKQAAGEIPDDITVLALRLIATGEK